MKYVRMPIEIESPEQMGYENVKYNLTESSFSDAVFKDLKIDINNLVLCYGHHVGKQELLEQIATEDPRLTKNDALITAGAAAGLFIIATSLLDKNSHLIVVRPNYATNIETPKAIGCEITYHDLEFENNFRIDLKKLEKSIQKNTKYISITVPHNPTGTMLTMQELQNLVSIAEKYNIYLLVDETYRDLSFIEKLPVAASLSNKVISVSSLSKAYGLPGIRIGWIITKDKKLQELFLAAKEQIYVCNSVVDEEIAFQFLQNKITILEKVKKDVAQKRNIVDNWMHNNSFVEWVAPSGGVVCFPRIKKEIQLDISTFYHLLNTNYQTYVGPGHWFEMDKRFMRIGYGWPSQSDLQQGLTNITNCLKNLTAKQ